MKKVKRQLPHGIHRESRHCVELEDGTIMLYEDYLDKRIDELEKRIEALED